MLSLGMAGELGIGLERLVVASWVKAGLFSQVR